MEKEVKKKKSSSKKKEVENKKIHTPFELFGDEGISKTGWAGLLIPFLLKLEKYNKEHPDNPVSVEQIKEKFSTLRVYLGLAPKEFHNETDKLDRESNHICMDCGSTHNVGKTKGGWITTLCEECAKKAYNTQPVDLHDPKSPQRFAKEYPLDKFPEFYDENDLGALSEYGEDVYLEWANNINDYVKNRHDEYKDFWYLNYDSVHIRGIIPFALWLQDVIERIANKYDHWKYVLFHRWRYNRKKTFKWYLWILFWKYTWYRKWDFIPVEVKLPYAGTRCDIRTNQRGWDGKYCAVYKGFWCRGVDSNLPDNFSADKMWKVYEPTDWKWKDGEFVKSWRKHLHE